MRIFKFRAWDPVNKKMCFSDEGTEFLDSEGAFPDVVIDITHAINKWEWMQFTGLKNKEGIDIFEGDICRWGGINWQVEYLEDVAGFVCFDKNGNSLDFSKETAWQMKVLGNIKERSLT